MMILLFPTRLTSEIFLRCTRSSKNRSKYLIVLWFAREEIDDGWSFNTFQLKISFNIQIIPRALVIWELMNRRGLFLKIITEWKNRSWIYSWSLGKYRKNTNRLRNDVIDPNFVGFFFGCSENKLATCLIFMVHCIYFCGRTDSFVRVEYAKEVDVRMLNGWSRSRKFWCFSGYCS